jgi:hypothetical protein
MPDSMQQRPPFYTVFSSVNNRIVLPLKSYGAASKALCQKEAFYYRKAGIPII